MRSLLLFKNLSLFFFETFIIHFWDSVRYFIYSGVLRRRVDQASMQASLMMHAHTIEKGLSFKNIKPNFGEDNIRYIISKLNEYINKYSFDEDAAYVYGILNEYFCYHKNLGVLNEELFKPFSLIIKGCNENNCTAATKAIIPNVDFNLPWKDFKQFAMTRHSVRNFSPRPVDREKLKEAIEIAKYAPSVCNRQSWRVRIFDSKDRLDAALACQWGNRGFGDQAKAIILVTGQLNHFFTPKERNQAYIDGGLFSMALVYALHSFNLATCCLNLSLNLAREKQLRTKLKLKDSEVPIMMIAIGHYPENIKVAYSKRKALENIMINDEPYI